MFFDKLRAAKTAAHRGVADMTNASLVFFFSTNPDNLEQVVGLVESGKLESGL
jgi:hypothetical protein